MRKIVFFDVDGTLVDNPTQVIPESAARAISQLRRNGHLAVVNTGRPPEHIDPRILALGFDGVIAGCGMWVQAEGRVIHCADLTSEDCARARDLVRQCRMECFFEAPHGLILCGGLERSPEVVHEVQNILDRGLTVTEENGVEPIFFHKLVTYDRPDSDPERFVREISRDFDVIDRGSGMKEMVPKGNSKSTGMARILAHFGLTREDAVAFGDSTNDLPMFACVKTAVAIGGGDPRLLAKADLVTDPVLSDGVANGLMRLGLI